MRPPDPGQVERFRHDLVKLTGAAPVAGGSLGLAVSGGPDSMAMLLLGAAAWPGAVTAATVDHGLRPEAADEAAMVAGVCAQLGVAHATLPPPPGIYTGNLQERARTLRYAALEAWAAEAGATWIAVAHQRDDVAETLLMRARRGSGASGLAAMRRARALRYGTLLVRPLLDWSRAELEGITRCAGLQCVEDRSNADPRFDRARIRALIADTPDLVPSRLALSAQNLRHAEDLIEWLVARELPGRVTVEEDESVTLDPADAPYELRRRLVRWAVEHARLESGLVEDWHAQGLDRLVATLDGGGIGPIAGVIGDARSGKWRFRLAPPRRSH
jgi:tRNA(Ile)-lysidine synthase